jgi:hypothetical protein
MQLICLVFWSLMDWSHMLEENYIETGIFIKKG